MIKGKKIFITGATGFIGSNLCKRLIEDNEIVAYDNGRRDALKFTGLIGHKNLKVVKGDILDEEMLRKSIEGCNIVIHLAAMAGVHSYFEQPVKTMEVNAIGTYNVLKAAQSLKGLELFINFATSEMYGVNASNVKETDETKQGPAGDFRFTYSVSKLAAEHICFAFAKQFGIPMISLRPFNIYGPGQVGEGAIQIFARKAIKDEDLIVTGDGSTTRAWCYIDDMVDAIILCIEKRDTAKGNLFNIGNPDTVVTTLELAKKIVSISSSKSKIKFEPHHGTDIKDRSPVISKAKEILGYSPKVGLDEGIKMSIEWYKNNAEEL